MIYITATAAPTGTLQSPMTTLADYARLARPDDSAPPPPPPDEWPWWTVPGIAGGLIIAALLAWAITTTVLLADKSGGSSEHSGCIPIGQADLPMVINVTGKQCYVLIEDLSCTTASVSPTTCITVVSGDVRIYGQDHIVVGDGTRRIPHIRSWE